MPLVRTLIRDTYFPAFPANPSAVTAFTPTPNALIKVTATWTDYNGASGDGTTLTCSDTQGYINTTAIAATTSPVGWKYGAAAWTGVAPSSPSSTTISVGFGGNVAENLTITVEEFTGYDTVAPIRQVKIGDAGYNSGAGSITLDSSPLSASIVTGASICVQEGSTGAAVQGSDFTLVSSNRDNGWSVASNQYRGGSTSASVAWADFGGDGTGYGTALLAVEVAAAGGGAYTLTAAQGSYSLTGQVAVPRAGRRFAAAQGSYALTGQAVTLRVGRRFAAAQGSYSLSGQSAALRAAHSFAAAQGSYALTGQAAGSRAGRRFAAAQGSYALTGQTTGLRVALRLTAAQGSYGLAGQAAGFISGRPLVAAPGGYSLTGITGALRIGRSLVVQVGYYSLAGYAAIVAPVSSGLGGSHTGTRVVSVRPAVRVVTVKGAGRTIKVH